MRKIDKMKVDVWDMLHMDGWKMESGKKLRDGIVYSQNIKKHGRKIFKLQTAYGGTMDMIAMTFSETWITAVFPTGDVQYLSAEAYNIMDPGTTAANTAIEYWTKYDEYD